MTADHIAVADVLDDAADYIEKHGWCQNRLTDIAGRVCAAGAIRAALGIAESEIPGDTYHAVRHAIYRVAPLTHEVPLPSWNDAPDRTEQDVLDMFRAAAKAERRLADEQVPA
jgi:hypothetical protein